jgi:carboxypeptidase PM20D1
MRKSLIVLAAIFLTLAGIVILRTACFSSKQIEVAPAEDLRFDRAAVQRLSRAVQYKTVSRHDGGPEFPAEFLRFHQFLRVSFPRVHETLTREVIGGHSLLYTWEGREHGPAILLLAHMDVVPVEEQTGNAWSHPPFSGQVADGYIWGRGTMDDKAGVLGILEAVEHLLGQSFQPRNTIYLAFGHDEESGGSGGAAKIAAVLRSRKVKLQYVLDEGGNITHGIIPGIEGPVALIGIAEKGYVSLELQAESYGGHTSMPPDETAIRILTGALHKLEQSRLPSEIPVPTRKFLESIGPETPWLQKMALANLWLFEPLLIRQLERSPLTASLIRTTQVPTILQAGIKDNVLPTQARAVINFRILPGQTVAGVTKHVQKVISDPRVEIKVLPYALEPSEVTDTGSAAYKTLDLSIRQIMPGVKVAPFLLMAATDSRHYAGLSKNIFRFLPITLREQDARRYHGIDERISAQDYERCVRFYIQLIKNSQSD